MLPNESSDHEARIINVLREYLDQRTNGLLALSQRVDFLVSELGKLSEVKHRIELIDQHVQKNEIVGQTLIKIVEDAQEDFDTRTQIILRDAEALRGGVREAMVSFQYAQDDQNKEWDEKWLAVQRELEKVARSIDGIRKDEAAIGVARIGARERVLIALITVVGSALMALVTSLIVSSSR